MFSRATDASKVALAWLVALLRRAGYRLLDCQFMTEHLASLGAVPISREAYLALLAEAVAAGPGAAAARSLRVVARRGGLGRRGRAKASAVGAGAGAAGAASSSSSAQPALPRPGSSSCSP